MLRALVLLIAFFGCAHLAGCAGAPVRKESGSFVVPESDYQRTFVAAKDVLRDAGFTLDRVDASRGVISTRPRASSGFATPWIEHSTSPGAGAAGVLHRERRVATVRFDRPDPGNESGETIVAHVEVTVQRLGAPGRKPDPASIRLTSTWTGGAGPGSGQTAFSTMEERADPALSARLARQIEDLVAKGAPHPDAG